MKNLLLYACCLFALVTLADAPRFVTGRMLDRRNGLTDAQYEYLWSIGKNPTISQRAARDWAFRASRYQNVTNWLDICGQTNDFAALSYTLQDDNFKLEETNATLVATNKENGVDLWTRLVAWIESTFVLAHNRRARERDEADDAAQQEISTEAPGGAAAGQHETDHCFI